MVRNVLILSGRPPFHSAGLVQDRITILEKAGCKVDLLTLYNFKGQQSNHYNIFNKTLLMKLSDMIVKYPWIRSFRCIYHLPYVFINRILNFDVQNKLGKNLLVCEDEENPPIDPELILKNIKNKYDYFIMIIAQDLLTSKTINDIYNKYNKPILILSPDMYYYTGNCFFSNDCQNYINECHNCPAYTDIGKLDIAHKNFVYKKKVFENIRCAFKCNRQVKEFIVQSHIISENKLFTSSFFLDTNEFKPLDSELCKNKLNIPKSKSFIIMARYLQPNDIDWNRKGGPYLLETIKSFYSNISEKERQKCLLLLVGSNSVSPEHNFLIDTLCLGNLSRKDLIIAYNASNVFFCPSINDPGPSMVNQSLACSTPVVAFNQGTALDVVENGITGYKAELYDTARLTEGLLELFRMNEDKYKQIRTNARKKAEDCNSFDAGARFYTKIFESFENGTL